MATTEILERCNDALERFLSHCGGGDVNWVEAGNDAWNFCRVTKEVHYWLFDVVECSGTPDGEFFEPLILILTTFEKAVEDLLSQVSDEEIDQVGLLLQKTNLESLMSKADRVGGERNLALLRILKTKASTEKRNGAVRREFQFFTDSPRIESRKREIA